ncbi:MAG: hypothetical protein NTZ40_12235 [Cyanobacteria bacterium]|nr:hypothetical protein [Cyanobacteriota bacterium]
MTFFSILLQGALLTWLLMGEVGPIVLGDRYAKLAGAQAWAVFLFAIYLFSQLVFLLGSWLAAFYDWSLHYTLKPQTAPLRADVAALEPPGAKRQTGPMVATPMR